MIGRETYGVIVYLPQEGRGIGLVEKLKAYALQIRDLIRWKLTRHWVLKLICEIMERASRF